MGVTCHVTFSLGGEVGPCSLTYPTTPRMSDRFEHDLTTAVAFRTRSCSVRTSSSTARGIRTEEVWGYDLRPARASLLMLKVPPLRCSVGPL